MSACLPRYAPVGGSFTRNVGCVLAIAHSAGRPMIDQQRAVCTRISRSGGRFDTSVVADKRGRPADSDHIELAGGERPVMLLVCDAPANGGGLRRTYARRRK